jgi:3-hydroxyisobutyrate dehydrogenase
MAKIAFIGLGTMGLAMASHLQQHHLVTVYNRTRKKAEDWCQHYGGRLADTPRQAAAGADHAIVCVGNDDDVRQVLLGEIGALAGMNHGSCLIDHTTTSVTLAREIGSHCQERKVAFMDAPVSGGSEGAKNGNLTIMCGADQNTFAKLVPLLQCYAANITRIGPVGSGQAAKMINQICVAGALQGLAEGLHLAQALQLDIPRVIDAISQGAASSWQMTHRWQSMMAGDFTPGFAVKWMAKDLGFCLEEADRLQIDLPLARQVEAFFQELKTRGDGELDITRLISRLT